VVPKQLVRNAATAIVCLLITTSVGSAQQRSQPQVSAAPSGSYQSQPAASVIGTYKSDDFYPSPLVLNITGVDRYGNLSGSIWGMRTKPQTGEDPAWEHWQKVFGRDARAYYRNGQVIVTFSNGATYTLNQNDTVLRGTFVAKDENRDMKFLKSYGVASR
jgi:hypothetical protein